MYLDEVISKNW